MPHIAILVHEHGALDDANYYLLHMVRLWRESGICVSEVRGPGNHVEADVAMLHVNLTVVPDDHMSLAARYPKVINGSVKDISKRRVSHNVLEPDDPYDGPVIVKTDRNNGGYREGNLYARGSTVRRYARAVRKRLPLAYRNEIPEMDYPIFPSAKQVPPGVWSNTNLIVERYQPEMSGSLYCLRTWLFFGDRSLTIHCYGENPIVKTDEVLRREFVNDVPDELRRVRDEFGFDYGKFDYGIVDGKVVLYDTNRTPVCGDLPLDEWTHIVKTLASGIESFL